MKLFAVALSMLLTTTGCNRNKEPTSNGNANSGGGAGSPSLQMEVLYPVSDPSSRPVAILDGFLYWRQDLSIMRARADGSSTPQEIGTTGGSDISLRMIAVSSDFVYWQSIPTLVRYNVQSGAVDKIQTQVDEPGGPSLAVGDEWIVVASPGCTAISILDAETHNAHHVTSPEEIHGGVTGLAELDGWVYCSNGPRIVRSRLGSDSVEVFYRDPDPYFLFGSLAIVDGRLFVDRRQNAANPDNPYSLQAINIADATYEEVLRLPGRQYVLWTEAESRSIFLGHFGYSEPLAHYDLSSGSLSTFGSDVHVRSNLVSDGEFFYWSNRNPDDSTFAIVRQRKPSLSR